MKKLSGSRNGFTVIELLVVVVIIVILGSILWSSFSQAYQRVHNSKPAPVVNVVQ